MSHARQQSTRLLLAAALSALAVMAFSCGSKTKKITINTNTQPGSTAATVVGSIPLTAAAAQPTAAATGLSGTWSGQYSGAASGTFTLTWQQSGSKLSGTIKISSFGNAPNDINGTVQGNAISFGTVGSQALSYTGTVSGNSMSGTWQLGGGAGGSWNASKS